MSGLGQEAVPYEVMLRHTEQALHQAVSDAVVQRARLEIRDQTIADQQRRIAELTDRLAAAVRGNGTVFAAQVVQDHPQGEHDIEHPQLSEE